MQNEPQFGPARYDDPPWGQYVLTASGLGCGFLLMLVIIILISGGGRLLVERLADRWPPGEVPPESWHVHWEMDVTAYRKYEEGFVKAQQGAAEAEGLYLDAIALWEELLPLADNEEYRIVTVGQLTNVYYLLGELQQQLGKAAEAEKSLHKAIEYGQQGVALDSDRPLTKYYLELACQSLAFLRSEALQEEIDALYEAERFAEVADRYRRAIDEQQEEISRAANLEVAEWLLASRLDQLARLLAHCPDDDVRDTSSAVGFARRAVDLQPDEGAYWYTLAMAQYRNGDWHDSLAALERLEELQGEFDSMDWLLVAMNRYQLGQTDEARTALGRADEFMEQQQRDAEGNVLLWLHYDLQRTMYEALRLEAEELIEGEAASGVG